MLRQAIRSALAVGFVFAVSGVAVAGNMCLKDARNDAKACKTGCQTQLRDDVAICRDHDPICAQTCREGRNECTGPIIQANLTGCLDQCEPSLETARTTCKAQVGCGGSGDPCGFNPAYISCLNPAQAAAFACRDTCRDAFRLNANAQAALDACEASFKTCVKGCPPPPAN